MTWLRFLVAAVLSKEIEPPMIGEKRNPPLSPFCKGGFAVGLSAVTSSLNHSDTQSLLITQALVFFT
jgi:hypothetical protein